MELRRRKRERPHKMQEELNQPVIPLEPLAAADAVKEEEEDDDDDYENLEAMSESGSDSSFERNEEWLAEGEKGCNREKLTLKNRAADVLEGDSPAQVGESQEKAVEEGQDVGRMKRRCRRVNVRCEPKTICEVVRLLSALQREKVKELGFECLFDFNMDTLGSRDLIVWLMDHLDPNRMVLDFGGNRKLHVTEHTVSCVLGLHRGDLDPPSSTDKLNVHPLRLKLGVPEGNDIEIKCLIQKIQSGNTDRFTMQCVMMIVLAKLLACSSALYISSSVWSMVQDIDNFGNMDWCKFTVDHLRYSARKWKKPGGMKNTVYGCSALLVMYYLDNLNCKQKLSCVEVPRVKFFGNGMIGQLVGADKLRGEDGLSTFGNLNLRIQRGTCYDERTEPSRHMPTSMLSPVACDISGVFSRPQEQPGDIASSSKAFCVEKKRKVKTMHQQFDRQQIEKQQPQDRRQEYEGAVAVQDAQESLLPISCNSVQKTNGGIAISEIQEPRPAAEAPVEVHMESAIPDIPEETAITGDHIVAGGSEDSNSPVPAHGVQPAEEAVQIASNFINKQVKDFMAGTSEPEILESGLSKLVSLLAQMRAIVSSEAENFELKQQVRELTEKLSNKEQELEATRASLRGAKAATQEAQSAVTDTEEELEVTRATLRGAQASMLEAQSAVAAMNSLALRLSATFVRLGDTRPGPSPTVASSSLEEAVKLLEDRVSLIEPVSRSHATSLAQSSAAFVAAALLCRDRERGVEGLRDAVAKDARRFVRSQGPEFHSLVAQVVDAVKQEHGNAPRMQGSRATRNAGTSNTIRNIL